MSLCLSVQPSSNAREHWDNPDGRVVAQDECMLTEMNSNQEVDVQVHSPHVGGLDLSLTWFLIRVPGRF